MGCTWVALYSKVMHISRGTGQGVSIDKKHRKESTLDSWASVIEAAESSICLQKIENRV